MTFPPPPPQSAQVPPVQHFWTVGPADRRRYATQATRMVFTRPLFLLAGSLLALIVVVGVLQRTGSPITIVTAALVLFVLPPLIWWTTYRSGRITLAPGSQWASGFNNSGMMIANPDGTVMLTWDSITAVEPKGLVVLVRTKARRAGIGIPAPLFPPAAVDFARHHI